MDRGPGLQARTDRACRGTRVRRSALHRAAPKTDSGSAPPPKAPGQKGLETAISKANTAVAQSQASAKAAEKAAGQPSTTTGTKGKAKAIAVAKPKAPAAPAKAMHVAKPLPKLEAGDLSGPMLQDLTNGKVVVALFYNARAPDDNAALRAVRSANTRHGRVVLHSIPDRQRRRLQRADQRRADPADAHRPGDGP